MSLRGTFFVGLICSTTAFALPQWFPTNFSKASSENSALHHYLQQERLDIADSIHSVGSVEVDGIRLAVHCWIPKAAAGTVFLVHGYFDHSGVWSDHIQRLLGRNLAVVAWDLPGHGLSGGLRMDVDSFGQYAKGLRAMEDSLKTRAPKPWSLVGHSLGGAIALDRARQKDFPYSKVCLIAPMLRYHGWNWIGVALPVVSLFKDSLARNRNLASSSDTNFLRRLKSDSLEGWISSTHWLKQVRVWNAAMETATLAPSQWLLLQGGLDQTVDWRWGTPWLQERIRGLKIRNYPLARHHLHNEGGRTGLAARKDFDDFLCGTSSQSAK